MRQRLSLLDAHDLKLDDIQRVIAEMGPLPGAKEFLDGLRQDYQVIILSDTFYEFAQPLMHQLGQPTLFCHRLEISSENRVADYRLRKKDHKRESVESLKQLNFKVYAAGDSYNDTAMLREAHAGFLFRAPDNVITEFPQFSVCTEFDELRALIDAAAGCSEA
jgi:phosphoserine/homoserine phosphotransferase